MKILCLDGGGIRGIATAHVLSYIEQVTSKPIYQLFDLIVGTSTGGIIACGLTLPDADGRNVYWADDLEELYIQERHRIFHRSFAYRLRSLNGYALPKYDGSGLEQVIHEYFGKVSIGEALTPLMLTAYCCYERRAFFFKSEKAQQSDAYQYTFSQAAIATASAPTYFPSYKLGRHNLIDGGVHSNNPVMCAIAEAISKGVSPKQIKVLSIGTGTHKQAFPYLQVRKWGALEWIKAQNTTPLVDVMLDGDETAYQAKQILLNENYLRLDYEFNQKMAMDDVSFASVEACLAMADTVIKNHADKIKNFF